MTTSDLSWLWIRASSVLKSEISLAYCEFNTLFELAGGGRPLWENALPAKTPRDTGRKRSTEGVTEAAEVTRGDTVHDVDSTKQHVRRERERVKQEDERVAALSCCRGRGQRTGNTRWVCGRCRAALTAGLRWPSSSPLQVKCCCCWAALYPLDYFF